MTIKISDLVKNHKLKQEGVTEEQIFECHDEPELTDEAFGSEVFAKQYGEKVLVISAKDNMVIDIIFTKLANDISFYKENKDLNLYQIAFTATGDKSFCGSNSGGEIWGKVNKGSSRKE